MEAIYAQREEKYDTLGYFLAGHQAPMGTYREMQTGHEIRLEEAGILPATCDGHVAVYVRQTGTWAQISGKTEGIAQ